ncbi:hypothetical protein Tco_1450832, partial [Tanacetum coccineum]
RMYVAVFGVDVPTTQSQPIESTKGTYRTTSAPRTPNPAVAEGEQNDNQNDPGTRLDPKSNKESLKVEITAAAEQPVNDIEEEEESAKDDYELRRKEKRKHVEESTNTPSPTTIRSPRIHSTLISLDTEKL